jgi:hypothetical protein
VRLRTPRTALAPAARKMNLPVLSSDNRARPPSGITDIAAVAKTVVSTGRLESHTNRDGRLDLPPGRVLRSGRRRVGYRRSLNWRDGLLPRRELGDSGQRGDLRGDPASSPARPRRAGPRVQPSAPPRRTRSRRPSRRFRVFSQSAIPPRPGRNTELERVQLRWWVVDRHILRRGRSRSLRRIQVRTSESWS